MICFDREASRNGSIYTLAVFIPASLPKNKKQKGQNSYCIHTAKFRMSQPRLAAARCLAAPRLAPS